MNMYKYITYCVIWFLSMQICLPVSAGPLHDAAKNGDIAAVMQLHNQSINLNTIDDYRMTALHFASYSGYTNVVEYLLKNSADTDIQNNSGYTALILAIDGGNNNIARMLIENGADVNRQNDSGETALILACEQGDEKLAQYLIENGANVNVSKSRGTTPLSIALDNKNMGLAKLLINSHADIDFEQFPIVIKSNDYEMVKIFLEKGADPNKKYVYYDPYKLRPYSITPIEMATSTEIKELLREYGAKGRRQTSPWDSFGDDE